MSVASDKVDSSSLTDAVRRGTLTLCAAQIVSLFVSLCVLALLYRILGPLPYGLFGMAVPVILILRVFSSLGLNVVTVQRPEISAQDLHTLFWLQQLLGVVAALATMGLAPIIAWVYGTPQLTLVIVAMSATSPLISLGLQHQALLERQLRLGALSIARIVGQVSGGIAGVLAAMGGLGIWALIIQQYIELMVLNISVWTFVRWRPAFQFCWSSLRGSVSFGGYWTLSCLLLSVGQNVDKLLLAALAGGSSAGLVVIGMYSQAFQLMMKPVYLVTNPVTGIMLPALSRAAAERELYQTFVQSFYRMIAVMLLPCGVALTIVASDLMLVLGGNQWSVAGWLLACLAPVILAQGFINIVGSIFASMGRADRLFILSLFYTALLTVGSLTGIEVGRWFQNDACGIARGLAVGYSVVVVGLLLIPYTWFTWNVVGVRSEPICRSLLPAMIGAVVMGVIQWVVHQWLSNETWSGIWRLTIVSVTGIAVYGACTRREIVWFVRQIVRGAKQ